MLLIREVFIAKPGHAGELAKMMKEGDPKIPNVKVMLDMATNYNKIVMEYEMESLAKFEEMMNQYRAQAPTRAQAQGPKYTDLYLTGKREIYRIVD